MTILSVNTFSSLPPVLSTSGSDTTETGNDRALGGSEAPSLLDWLPLRAVAGGCVSAVLDAVLNPQPGTLEQAANELKKGGVPRLLESLGGMHPIGNQGVSERKPID